MANSATIYKAVLQLADMDRGYYADHALTIARHPSETDERMMVRVLAFALHAHEALAFGRGLSAADEPDLWRKDLTGAITLWIDVGLPDERALKRACARAEQVAVVAYGGRAVDHWWSQHHTGLARFKNLRVIQLPYPSTQALARLANRQMQLQCNIQEGHVSVLRGSDIVQFEPVVLLTPNEGA